MSKLLERFLKYVAIDTRSDDMAETVPSSAGQWDLAKLLVAELKELGLADIVLTEHCFVHAVLPSNSVKKLPVIGFMAHLDTYPGFNGGNVKPIVHSNYQGEKLILNESTQTVLCPIDFPDLLKYLGDDIVTTDGNSLLGADDKAGIAEIMDAVEYLIEHPEIERGEIRVVFSPDEETDRGGLEMLDQNLLPVDFVITLDGDGIGEVNFENFNAAHANVVVTGRSVHTGEAKGRMINAVSLACEWIQMLPKDECPECTEGYEGFFHIEELSGNVEQAKIYCLIRDFDDDGFMKRKELLKRITETMTEKYGSQTFEMKLTDDYRNMKSVIERNPVLIEGVVESMRASGIVPKILPIRGGTDGAMLAEIGILAPNVFLGGHNYHGQYEFISVQAMEAASRVIVNLVRYFANHAYEGVSTEGSVVS